MGGIFIVIDGTDGSGKATQTRLLVERLGQGKIPFATISFPQYQNLSSGPTREYLSGKYGRNPNDVSPYQGSILYAVDRFDASFQIRSWLEENRVVVADRYVSSNMGHQGSKISDPEERRKFFEWNDHLEYGIFNLPKPDLNIILHVPADISLTLAKGSSASKGGVVGDIHEHNEKHLRAAEKSYLEIVETFPGFNLIECADEQGILASTETIHKKIWSLISPLV